MEYTSDHDAMTSLLAGAAERTRRMQPLPGALRAEVEALSASATGSEPLSSALRDFGQQWSATLTALAVDGEVFGRALAGVDARYVATELTTASRFARER